MKCRFCSTELVHIFVDLGSSPASNSFLSKDQLNKAETYYPLRLFVCEKCFLVQIDEYKKSDEIFNSDYAYFSSFSKTWLDHARKYVEMITERLRLTSKSKVIEIASNDGYLLQYFIEKQIPCLGIEPSSNTADTARKKGIETIVEFFTEDFAENYIQDAKKADLIIGNNVLAHVPDINDFVTALKLLLDDNGSITLEFPHLMRLIEHSQFDTIYHEHFSYLSLHTVRSIFKKSGLRIYNVEELITHGGSLRIYACHEKSHQKNLESVNQLLDNEAQQGLIDLSAYQHFQAKANRIKNDFLLFLLEKKRLGKTIVGYGAAAKGNTLLNYAGVKPDLLEYVCDAAPSKQGKFLPGSHLPVVNERKIKESQPDFVVIFPWNIKDEIMNQLDYIKEWEGRFVVSVPVLEIFD
ncbi:MAG: class I SAM-dependent methyltransferase [Desulfobacterales bacterium]|nr:class I SAM-dependent methyltransferase [Desulfobacterales bacterium]